MLIGEIMENFHSRIVFFVVYHIVIIDSTHSSFYSSILLVDLAVFVTESTHLFFVKLDLKLVFEENFSMLLQKLFAQPRPVCRKELVLMFLTKVSQH